MPRDARPRRLFSLVVLAAAVGLMGAGGGGGGGEDGPAPAVARLLVPGRTPPLLVAHRGLSARYPENTLAAFRAAADEGARMLELDVGLTADGQVVVLHDETLDRTTDGSGSLSASPLAEITGLDAGSWFAPEFAGEPLPTLAQVLDELGSRIAINVEIKPEAVRSTAEGGIEEQVVAMVRERGLGSRVVFSSFEPAAVGRIERMAPELHTALLYHHEMPFDPVELLALYGVDGLHMNRRHVTPEIVEKVHESGRYVGAYTANARKELFPLLWAGVDAIFTDDPTAAARELEIPL